MLLLIVMEWFVKLIAYIYIRSMIPQIIQPTTTLSALDYKGNNHIAFALEDLAAIREELLSIGAIRVFFHQAQKMPADIDNQYVTRFNKTVRIQRCTPT